MGDKQGLEIIADAGMCMDNNMGIPETVTPETPMMPSDPSMMSHTEYHNWSLNEAYRVREQLQVIAEAVMEIQEKLGL